MTPSRETCLLGTGLHTPRAQRGADVSAGTHAARRAAPLFGSCPCQRQCLGAQGWSLGCLALQGGKLWYCTPDARDRASVVGGCKTEANYASLKLSLWEYDAVVAFAYST